MQLDITSLKFFSEKIMVDLNNTTKENRQVLQPNFRFHCSRLWLGKICFTREKEHVSQCVFSALFKTSLYVS